MNVILWFAVVALILVTLACIGFATAEEGWEDDSGYHKGRRE